MTGLKFRTENTGYVLFVILNMQAMGPVQDGSAGMVKVLAAEAW